MDKKYFDIIEEEYRSIKKDFQERNNKEVAKEISRELPSIFSEVFSFLVDSFGGKLRLDGKTPLVFHSIFLTKLLYECGIMDEDNLLIGALHDVLEDTKISEDELLNKKFMKGKTGILSSLKILKENVLLSREPNGKTLPPRYREHISRMIGAPKEVVNVEILDRFSDLMDLEYITELSEEEKILRLKSKMIKVRSFVENITHNRKDYNENCFWLFKYKAKQIEEKYGLIIKAELLLR